MKVPNDCFYAQFDHASGLWCIFDSRDDWKPGRALASYSDEGEAKEEARRRNRERSG
jgi:hypothetical protein